MTDCIARTRNSNYMEEFFETESIPDMHQDFDCAGNRLPRGLYHVDIYNTSLERVLPSRHNRDLRERPRIPGLDDVGGAGTSVDILAFERYRFYVPFVCYVGDDGSRQGRKL